MSVSPRPGRPPPTRRPPSLVQAPALLRWLSRLDRPATDASCGSGAGGAGGAGGASFAQQLSPWLDWTDAIALSSVLQAAGRQDAVPVAPSAAGRGPQAAAGAWAAAGSAAAEARQLHAGLLQAIRDDPAPLYSHHQRAMEERISPSRARLRAALAACTPPLRQLAALDEVLDRALAAHERRLLARLPHLLRHQQAQAAAAGSANAGVLPAEPEAVRELLLAELQARWQAVDGLLQALDESLAARVRVPA